MKKMAKVLISVLLAFTFVMNLPAYGADVTATLSTNSVQTVALFSFSGNRPVNLGVSDHKLTPCPDSPNCVSSQSIDGHSIAPLSYSSSPEQAFADLKQVIQAQPRAKIITETPDYIYAEFTSALMGFVDDVEFYLDKQKNLIDVRSASRLGESDLGANRKRVETIRTSLLELNPKA